MTTKPKDLACLSAGLDGDGFSTFKGLQVKVTTERSHRHRHGKFGHQIVAIPLETVVRQYPNTDVEVTESGASLACSAPAAQPQSGPSVDTSRDVDGVCKFVDNTAIASTGRAWIFDDLTRTLARWTSASRHHLTQDGTADLADLTDATTGLTGHLVGAFDSTGSFTWFTGHMGADLDRLR